MGSDDVMVIVPVEDIGETHFGGFLRKKRPRTDERASEQVCLILLGDDGPK